MFVLQTKGSLPIKVWLQKKDDLDHDCLKQAENLASFPFAHKHIALMPDTHKGYGMPIGGVLGSKNAIIPNAVGVDIGCGVAFVSTNIKVSSFIGLGQKKYLVLKNLINKIGKKIPTGFEKRKKPIEDRLFNKEVSNDHEKLKTEFYSNSPYQLGTLGGGNHFIELQKDLDEGNLCIMVHSGSRHLGHTVCMHFNSLAKKLNEKWGQHEVCKNQLAYLPVESKEGQAYIKWMNISLEFARNNRNIMLGMCKDILLETVQELKDVTSINDNIVFSGQINAHHNYASLEYHYGEDVWIHRKGAISAKKDEVGIIPGAMGSYSYVVKGLGSTESFSSCSHGAGRKLSRKQAKKTHSVKEVMDDLQENNVLIYKRKKSDIAEESRWAYKNIDDVMEQERDLVIPTKKLKTLAVLKG